MKLFILPLILVVTTCVVSAQKPLTWQREIDNFLTSNTVQKPFNGVVLVAQGGKILYQKKFGFANYEHKTPLVTNQQFIIGSISKQFTAVLVLKELAQKRLALNGTIKQYLPNFLSPWADSVTVHQLLNHSSGIVALDKPLAFKPGTQFLYSGTVTYNILRQIIEQTSQKSFSVLTKALFKQANMKHSLLPIDYRSGQLAEVYKDEKSQAFVKQKIDLATMTNETAGAGIITTAQDLLNWNLHLHQGKILQNAQYQLIVNKNIDRVHAIWGTIGYSYGMQIEQNMGITELGHSGYFEGYNGINYYCPASKTSLIVLANTDRFDDLKYTFDFAVNIRSIVRKNLMTSR